MKQITSEQVIPAMMAMFDVSMPTGIRALAVLAGGNNGKIFTDDPNHPRWVFVWEADDGTLYRGGKYDRDILSEVVGSLRQEGIVALGFRDGDASMDLFPSNPDAGAECLEFDRPIGASDLSPYLSKRPTGYQLHRMDKALWEQSPKREYNLNRYGSVDNFFDHGLAVCITQNGETVCEAYADMEIMGVREIGIRTESAHRKKGLATIACAHLIQLCEETGSGTYWDCVKFNVGSIALADKLGFQNKRAYKLLAWFKPKE
jgi:RimJ/RimL family protein N-acetyltransferase